MVLFQEPSLRKNCPNTEFFLVVSSRVKLLIQSNMRKYGTEKTTYFDTFHAVHEIHYNLMCKSIVKLPVTNTTTKYVINSLNFRGAMLRNII